MPESDPQGPSDFPPPANEARNLPVPIPRPRELAGRNGEGFFARALRAIFGWKSVSIRADLKDVLEDGAGAHGFSPQETAMLRNILALRERRVEDVMVPRADIIAVQRDIALGELMKVFEGAAPFAARGLRRDARRRDRHGPHPRPHRLHDRAGRRRRKSQLTAQEAVPGRARSQGDRSRDAAVVRQDHPRDAVRTAVDAGDRPARQDAGDAHPSLARDR